MLGPELEGVAEACSSGAMREEHAALAALALGLLLEAVEEEAVTEGRAGAVMEVLLGPDGK